MEKKQTKRWALSKWEPWIKYKENFNKNPVDGWMKIGSYISGPIIAFIGWVKDNLKLGVLFAIIITLIILVFRHVRTAGSLESPKKHDWIGLIVLVIFCLIILALFFPFTGNKIENLYFHTITPTYTSTILTPTNTPEPSPTFTPPPTNTPYPTSTPTITPTLTPTITPTFPSEEFQNSCIPDSWRIYPSYLMGYNSITPAPCLSFQSVGYAALTPGLQVAFKPPSDPNFIGLFRELPLGNFEIQSTITGLNFSPAENSIVRFYIMFFNSAIAGGYKDKRELTNSFMFSVDVPGRTPVLYFEKTPYAYSLKPTDKVGIICNKTALIVKCNVTGLPEKIDLPEMTFLSDWDSIFIGYYVDAKSMVRLDFTHFQIIPK